MKSSDGVVDTQSRVFIVEIQLQLMSRIPVGAYLLVHLRGRNMVGEETITRIQSGPLSLVEIPQDPVL